MVSCFQNDELIIQEMVDEISVSGVIFTHEMKNRAPYYSINYDDVSGSSSYSNIWVGKI